MNRFSIGRIVDLCTFAHEPQEITDRGQIEKDFRYWRVRIFYSMFVGYAFFYFTRKSLTFAMPALMQDLGYDKSQLGILASILFLSYGASKFFSGIMGDRSNPRYLMSVGLILTGLCNICFGLSSSIFAFALFWGLNGWFQGLGWPPCCRLLNHWYSQKERGSWWASWNVSHNVGGGLIPLLAAACIAYTGSWRYALYVPGILCIAAGLFLMNRLRDTPQSLGLPSIEQFKNDYEVRNQHVQDKALSVKEILFEYVLNNRSIWLLSLAYFFTYLVRYGINDWAALFLQEQKGYSSLGANSSITLFEMGGFVGSLCAGWGSDHFFRGRRGPVNVLFTVGAALSVGLLWVLPKGMVYLDSAAMFFIGLFIFGPQLLIGMAAAELCPKKAAATSSGFAGWFAYIGAACAGYPLGNITQNYGWEGFFVAMAVASALSLCLLLPLWNVQIKTDESRRPTGDQKSLDHNEQVIYTTQVLPMEKQIGAHIQRAHR
jgi:OPA family sugar phosphate sensor protein UhpC-like MFS transporter